MSDMIRIKNLGPLHDLLLRACPPNDEGMKSIAILAAATGYTPMALYKAIKASKMTPEMAIRIVGIADEGVSLDDFHPYVYGGAG